MPIKLIIIDTFDARRAVEPPEYYYEGEHMDRFLYSPEGCKKVIKTVFE